MRMLFTTSYRTAILCCLVAACPGELARGDTLELTNGGHVEGTLVSPADGKGDYIIDTPNGRVTVGRAQVARVDATSSAEKEYASIAKSSPDTVESHWKLYEFCRDRKLRAQSQKHLSRILELDPEHAEARVLLGFRKHGGEWQTRDEIMAARGMIKFEGEWYTRQHVELLQRKKESNAAQVDWKKEFRRLRGWLTGNDQRRIKEARTEIAAIRDPAAAESLLKSLATESEPAIRRLWLDAAAQLDHPSVISAFVELSLVDPNDEMRLQCLDYLVASRRPGLAAPYLSALKSDDNVKINRAAVALGRIGDPEAIGPLIDVLVTSHRIKVSDNSDQMTVTGPTARSGGGLSMGGGGPKFVTRTAKNPDVLAALINLTGMGQLSYDQPAWKAWFAERSKGERVDLRRDL
jgi:hypothetical protein